MKEENTNVQMRKGVLEFCILSIVNEKDAYTSDLIERLKSAHLIVVEGTLYPLLTRLKNQGYLSYYWEESKAGPPRKYFKITENGIQFLNELRENWLDFVNSVNSIIQIKN
ncbi:MAG: PadR family transcriptional regulator [Bacteroidota bacterium]